MRDMWESSYKDRMMKRTQLYIVMGLVILMMAIFILAMRNDCRFNEEKSIDAIVNRKRDSLEREQMNRISEQLNEVTIQLDSINSIQNTNNVNEIQIINSIKASLNQIKRTGQRIINLMK